MVIDNFIEKIIVEGRDKYTINRKNIYDLATDCAKHYCEFLKIQLDDFYKGKELFKTIKYFMSDRFTENLFKGLNEEDKELANSFMKGIFSNIEAEEKKGENFDADVICNSLIDYIILYASVRSNLNKVLSKIDQWLSGAIKYEDIHYEASLSSFDYRDLINFDLESTMSQLRDLCYSMESIDEFEKDREQIEQNLKLDEIPYKKSKVRVAVDIIGVGAMFYVNPLLGLATAGFFKKVDNISKKAAEYNCKIIERNQKLMEAYCRFCYWELILEVCGFYYSQNYKGESNYRKKESNETVFIVVDSFGGEKKFFWSAPSWKRVL